MYLFNKSLSFSLYSSWASGVNQSCRHYQLRKNGMTWTNTVLEGLTENCRNQDEFYAVYVRSRLKLRTCTLTIPWQKVTKDPFGEQWRIIACKSTRSCATSIPALRVFDILSLLSRNTWSPWVLTASKLKRQLTSSKKRPSLPLLP